MGENVLKTDGKGQTMRGKKRQCPYSGYQECAQLELEYSLGVLN